MNLKDPHPDLTSGSGPAADMRFHHIGVAVERIEDALPMYLDGFGFRKVSEPVDVPPEQVRVCFIEIQPGVQVELVEGLGDASPVHGLLERSGPGTYHICYEVDDLDRTIKRLRGLKCLPFKRFEMPPYGRFAFLLTPDRQLFELCEMAN